MFRRLIGLGLLLWPTSLLAGAWTLPQGKVWGKVTFFQQSTDEWYLASPELTDGQLREPGARRPYRFDGKYESRAVFVEGFYGITERFDLGVQIPYFDQQFSDATRDEPPADAGFSDLRLFAKARLIQRPVVFTLKGGVKMPTGNFRNEDGLIPVGEGQWDFDLIGQMGRSLWPLPVYGNVELGYRFRLKNDEIDRDPGDEWFLQAEVGYQLTRRVLLMGKFELLRSDPATDFGLENRSQIKRITYVSPALLVRLAGETALEVGLRYSINGRNFPAGHQVTMGISSTLGG